MTSNATQSLHNGRLVGFRLQTTDDDGVIKARWVGKGAYKPKRDESGRLLAHPDIILGYQRIASVCSGYLDLQCLQIREKQGRVKDVMVVQFCVDKAEDTQEIRVALDIPKAKLEDKEWQIERLKQVVNLLKSLSPQGDAQYAAQAAANANFLAQNRLRKDAAQRRKHAVSQRKVRLPKSKAKKGSRK